MNMTDLDLNLLRAFDAIATEGNVTSAGERIGLSQPAMSNALARLRQLFDDPLFVRTPRGMRPTPFAQQLAQPVREALRLIQTALQQHADFAPRSSSNTFRFYMLDIGEMVFLPGLLERVKRDALGVKIEVVRIPANVIEISTPKFNCVAPQSGLVYFLKFLHEIRFPINSRAGLAKVLRQFIH
jgi:DNA-binding transcriptional LysR family regulator